jgi:penicillin amidase
MGYLHGRERSWQLDFFRRTWQGRKSEVLGPSELRQDFSMRLFNLGGKAHALYESLPADIKLLLSAYAEGVNRGTAEAMARGQYEFKTLGYRPEPWRAEDSIALLLLQAFDQTKESFIRQIDEDGYEDEWGAKAAPALFARAGVPWDTTILKPGEQPRGAPPARVSATPAAGPRAVRGPRTAEWVRALGRGTGQGSNSWVLAPSRSRTGHAWFANDPHLDLKHPPFWQWLNIQSPEFDLIGASLPGVPAVASGATRHVAWGITNSYLNVSRLAYVPESELGPEDPVERPWIWVRIGSLRAPFLLKRLRRTAEGWPVLPIDAPAGRAVVLRWTGFELKASDFVGVFQLPAAADVEQADAALATFGVPSWNFVFADDRGRIGYRAVGKVPANADDVPFGIPQMSLGELRGLKAFRDFLSPDEMPHVTMPARGFVATANNRQWPEGGPWHVGRAHSEGFRAFRIEELVRATPRHDLDSIRKIQCDVQAMDARFILPKLLQALRKPQGAREARAVEQLRTWDFVASRDCRACAAFQRWLDRILTDQDLDDTSLYRKLGEGDAEFERSVREELTAALDDLHVPPSGELPRWGDVHRAYFPHLAGDERFAAAPIATPGDDQTVDPGTSEWEGGVFHHVTGASQRLVVEMASPPRVYAVLAGPNADIDQREPDAQGGPWQRWRDCELQLRHFPLDWAHLPQPARRLVF